MIINFNIPQVLSKETKVTNKQKSMFQFWLTDSDTIKIFYLLQTHVKIFGLYACSIQFELQFSNICYQESDEFFYVFKYTVRCFLRKQSAETKARKRLLINQTSTSRNPFVKHTIETRPQIQPRFSLHNAKRPGYPLAPAFQ